MQDSQRYRTSPISEEYEKELQLIQDTHVLLENLAEREQATVKAILDGLYEVGSVRLINQRVSVKVLRQPLKGIARFSKPVFRIFAWRWFKKNSAELITQWLFDQVKFGDRTLLPDSSSPDAEAIDVVPVREALPPLIEKQATEILALRSRVSFLTVTVVILALLFGVTILT
ncbi:hypothetical protein PN498_01955 [Oscillatoria sp. CS-180]|uniref:hypothetical protein n=1 Tax=Oscillatoria sp. CS-180 TaxID=3021720 RepID=UPI00232DAEF6|nr:hypothetical protein [Oscillatoria sp. CS-180]MDB9524740.1 hypothetical protein [Oscillatoria sp. CS-180]